MHVEVAVIGGGIYGTAATYFLSKAGIRVALIEQDAIAASGATAFSRGIVRVYDPDPALAMLSLAGTNEFDHWEQLGYPGITPYRRTGCLYRVKPRNQQQALALTSTLQHSGYCFEWYTGNRLQKSFRFLKSSANDLVIWEPNSGYGDPRLASQNLAAAATIRGATIYERCKASAIDRRNGHWVVQLPYSQIQAQVLLVAGGAASRSLLPLLTVVTKSIGLLHMNSSVQLTSAVIDEVSETYIRPLTTGGYYCGTQVTAEAALQTELPPFGDMHLADACMRVQQLLKPPYVGMPVSGLMGFDGYTATYRPLVGFLKGYENLFVATGFSGRGFKYALPLSKEIARQIVCSLGYDAGCIKNEFPIAGLVRQFSV